MEKSTNQKWHPVYECGVGKFNTAGGHIVDLHNPKPETISIHDIASALSKICRFGGQTSNFYSVAQHSVLVCKLAPESLKKAALMHDATEAYLGDVIKPLKNVLGSVYENLESSFMLAICQKFNISPLEFPLIKQYDIEMLYREHDALQRGMILDWKVFVKSAYGGSKPFWEPEYARAMFLTEFQLVFNQEVKA